MFDQSEYGYKRFGTPEKLSEEEIKKIETKFKEFGLRADEDMENFTIHTEKGVDYIPKRKKIIVERKNGDIARINADKFIEARIKYPKLDIEEALEKLRE